MPKFRFSTALCLVLFMFFSARGTLAQEPSFPGLISREFIYEQAPFPECHASTLVQCKDGTLVAAWFGGTKEKNPDVGIWVARKTETGWSKPVEVANGVESAAVRYPCWNPVLFQPSQGPLLLFYKVGPDPDTWWGMLLTSDDNGQTWSQPQRLPQGIYGPIKNKPVELADGTLLCPTSTEDQGWRIHFEKGTWKDGKWHWQLQEPVPNPQKTGVIQPTILSHGQLKLQALCRSRISKIVETWSADGGKTWSELAATSLPNPNSGIDAVTLAEGRHLLVYNRVTPQPKENGWGDRSPLNLAISGDGQTWTEVGMLENEPGGEFSYPAIIQTSDGRVHISYTWKRKKVRHVVVDPAKMSAPDKNPR
ncbi:MAG: sialidase family protein [Pirellulales bacterium]|nr:sialidase family protein [Pirellulales bacterium]